MPNKSVAISVLDVKANVEFLIFPFEPQDAQARYCSVWVYHGGYGALDYKSHYLSIQTGDLLIQGDYPEGYPDEFKTGERLLTAAPKPSVSARALRIKIQKWLKS